MHTQAGIVGFGWGRGARQRLWRGGGGSFKRLGEFEDGALWNARVAAAAVPSYMYSSSPGEKLSEQVNNHI